ncbi:MAG: HAMP domain-containing protein [Chloroflexi bacterium]|nr:HAMP domain-containing protein [Chloroflexota bacterium]MBP7042526.1 HAMP domain-containing protein [Chloroflexota bacterium]
MKRSKHFRLGLFARLMLAFLIVIVAGGLVTIWLTRQTTAAQFTVYTTSSSRHQAELLAPVLSDFYAEQNTWSGVDALLAPASRDTMGGMMRHGQGNSMLGMWSMMGNRLLVVDENGRVLADTENEMVGQQLPADLLQQTGVPILHGAQTIGTVLVTASLQSTAQNEFFINRVNQAILLSLLAAGALALFFGGLIVWQVVRPLQQLTAAAQKIAAGNLTQQVNVAPGDEIGDLALAFNQMTQRLARAETLRNQMTADIAHELRTPLTVIQGNIEALQDGVFPLTVDALDPILDKTLLLRRLVEDLRQLTLAETGQLSLDMQPTDLHALAAQSAEAFQSTAAERAISLVINSPDELPVVNADRQRMQQVFMNLLANALRYTPDGGAVTIRLALEAGRVRVAVEDTGPGIPPEDRTNVFERFYRADQGRARAADGSGSGLGLAVVRSIVEAHGGQIGVESAPDQGAAFWFTLP